MGNIVCQRRSDVGKRNNLVGRVVSFTNVEDNVLYAVTSRYNEIISVTQLFSDVTSEMDKNDITAVFKDPYGIEPYWTKENGFTDEVIELDYTDYAILERLHVEGDYEFIKLQELDTLVVSDTPTFSDKGHTEIIDRMFSIYGQLERNKVYSIVELLSIYELKELTK